jgi:hypothetical protein
VSGHAILREEFDVECDTWVVVCECGAEIDWPTLTRAREAHTEHVEDEAEDGE